MPLRASDGLHEHAGVGVRIAEIVPAGVAPVRLLKKYFVPAWHTLDLGAHETLLAVEWKPSPCE